MLSLARDIDWCDEKACFHGLATALADLYAINPVIGPSPGEASWSDPSGSGSDLTGSTTPHKPSDAHRRDHLPPLDDGRDVAIPQAQVGWEEPAVMMDLDLDLDPERQIKPPLNPDVGNDIAADGSSSMDCGASKTLNGNCKREPSQSWTAKHVGDQGH